MADDTRPDLLALAKAGHFDRVEDAWLEVAESDPEDLSTFLTVADELIEREEGERAAVLLSLLLPHYEEHDRHAEAARILRRAVVASPEETELRKQLIDALRKAHPDSEGLDLFIKASDLAREPDVSHALEKLDGYMRCDVGCYLIHESGWGVGRVTRVSTARQTITIDFEGKKGHTMPLDGAADILKAPPADDFRVRVIADADGLREQAEEDPSSVIRSVLDTYGSKLQMRTVKEHLAGKVIPAGQWTKWWTKARNAVRRDPMIDMSDGPQPTFALREEALSLADETRKRFQHADDLAEKLTVFRDCASNHPEERELLAELAVVLRETGSGMDNPSQRIEISLAMREADLDAEDAAALLAGLEDPTITIRGIGADDLRRSALHEFRKLGGETWPKVYCDMLLGSSAATCDYVARELSAAGHIGMLKEPIDFLLSDANEYPEGLLWLWRRANAGKLPIEDFDISIRVVYEQMLRLVHHFRWQPDVVSKLRSGLAVGNFEAVRRLAENVSAQEAKRLQNLAQRCRGLSDMAQTAISDAFVAAHPDVFEDFVKPWEDENVIYTTREALDRQKQELDRLMTGEYLKICKAIGEAASRGDLTENAEFTAALEERDLLTKRAGAMREDVSRARIISSDIVSEDEVSIGSKVIVQSLPDGPESQFLILGPWDTDPDGGVLSYRAPLAQSLLGKGVGDVAVSGEGTAKDQYRIVSISAAVGTGSAEASLRLSSLPRKLPSP